MSRGIYYRQFKEALLGNMTERKIGDFHLVKEATPSGVDHILILSDDAYKERATGLKIGNFSGMKALRKKDQAANKPYLSAPISDEELDFIE